MMALDPRQLPMPAGAVPPRCRSSRKSRFPDP